MFFSVEMETIFLCHVKAGSDFGHTNARNLIKMNCGFAQRAACSKYIAFCSGWHFSLLLFSLFLVSHTITFSLSMIYDIRKSRNRTKKRCVTSIAGWPLKICFFRVGFPVFGFFIFVHEYKYRWICINFIFTLWRTIRHRLKQKAQPTNKQKNTSMTRHIINYCHFFFLLSHFQISRTQLIWNLLTELRESERS